MIKFFELDDSRLSEGSKSFLIVIGIGPVVQMVLPYVDMRKND